MSRLSLAIACAALAASSVVTADESSARSLFYEDSVSFPVCPTCSLADLQYIFADTKELLGLTKAALEAKGQVWYAKDQYVSAGCEFYTSMIPWDAALTTGWGGRRAEAVVSGSEYDHESLHKSSIPVGVAPPSICAAKAEAILAAKADFETAINNVLAGIQAVVQSASGCGSVSGSHHYRALYEAALGANSFGPANINYLATCLDKFKYLLESLLGLEKVALAKASYAATLEAKLASALSALAACEASYPGYKEGYGYGASEFWGVQRTYADQYYNLGQDQNGYRFSKCEEELATVVALEKEACYVQTKLVATVAEMGKIGTLMAAKAAKCFSEV